MNSWNGQDNVPVSVCRFVCDDAVHFADDSTEEKGVRLLGYRGDIIKHWFWGNLAFDMDGLYFASKKTPGLIDHNSALRLTYSKKQAVKPEVFIEGPFLSNPDSAKLKQDMIEGFPFQASLRLNPEIVEQIADDQKAKVNGTTLKGPGAIFRKAAILEISVCVFGVFKNTETTALSEADNDKNAIKFSLCKENEMAQEDQMTIETFIEKWPELHAEVFSAGKAEGLAEGHEKLSNLFKGVQVACGGDCELLVACFAEGKTVEQAYKMRADKLQTANKQLGEDLVKARQAKVDPAIQEFTQGGPAPTTIFAEATATDKQLEEHFTQTQQVQDEYGDVGSYLAYVRHNVRKK